MHLDDVTGLFSLYLYGRAFYLGAYGVIRLPYTHRIVGESTVCSVLYHLGFTRRGSLSILKERAWRAKYYNTAAREGFSPHTHTRDSVYVMEYYHGAEYSLRTHVLQRDSGGPANWLSGEDEFLDIRA